MTETHSFFIEPVPKSVGEHDVDTVLHLLLGRLAGCRIFEGMCNPPGGDWSGLSLLAGVPSREYRWLHLPRESGESKKRPDHVFQVFGVAKQPIVLIVESKNIVSSIEPGVGPDLIRYVQDLMSYPANAERSYPAGSWHISNKRIDVSDMVFVSAVAFIPREESSAESDSEAALEKSQADIAIAHIFHGKAETCKIELAVSDSSTIASEIVDYIIGIDPQKYGVSMRRGE